MGFGKVFRLEDFAVGAGEEFCAEIFADFKIGCVAQNGGGKQHGNDKVHVERASRGGGNSAGGKQQRVARQKRCYHQACFAEHDEKQDGVNPNAVLGGEGDEVLVDVEDEI